MYAIGDTTAILLPDGLDDWLTAGAFLLIQSSRAWSSRCLRMGLAFRWAAAFLPLAWRRQAPLAALSAMLASLLLIGVVGEPDQSGSKPLDPSPPDDRPSRGRC